MARAWRQILLPLPRSNIMNALFSAVRQFVRDEEGITAIEYGLIAAVMAAAITTAFVALGDGIEAAFQDIVAMLNV
jgi:pilus assembly protein Flp/PilA